MQVVDRIVDGIVDGTYRDDTLPSQDILADQFNVSRSVIREAVSILAARRMLDVRPKIGTHVRPLNDWQMIDEEVVQWRMRTDSDPDFLRDLTEFRALLAPHAAAQAARYASAGERAEIRAAYHALQHASDSETYLQAEVVLHTTIFKASGNQILQKMASFMCAALSPTARLASSTAMTGDDRDALDHLVDSIDAADPHGAKAAMMTLIELANRKTLKTEQPLVVG